MNGTRPSIAARCGTAVRSITSCTLPSHIMASPVCLHAITSEWSPKMEKACVPTVLELTCRTPGSSSPLSLYSAGTISISPCEAVYEVVSAPASSAPCIAPAAPHSLSISTRRTGCPNRFFLPLAAQTSTCAAIGEDGVIG